MFSRTPQAKISDKIFTSELKISLISNPADGLDSLFSTVSVVRARFDGITFLSERVDLDRLFDDARLRPFGLGITAASSSVSSALLHPCLLPSGGVSYMRS